VRPAGRSRALTVGDIRHYCDADPRGPRHYHLVLDSKLTLEACGELIVHAAQAFAHP
jgi:hypothetical protein